MEGYRLGDPIDDRRVGSPGGVADLNRVYTALDATRATGRGLRTTTGAPRALASSTPDAAAHTDPARRTLLAGQSTHRPGHQVVQVRRSSRLPAALRHATSLLGVAATLTAADVRQIARIVAEVAQDSSRPLERAGHEAQAAALTQHARLLTTVAQAAPREPASTRSRTPALAQLQQARNHLGVLRTAGVDLTPALAEAVAQSLPGLTVAFADAAQTVITGAGRGLLVDGPETARLRQLFPERPSPVTAEAAPVRARRPNTSRRLAPNPPPPPPVQPKPAASGRRR